MTQTILQTPETETHQWLIIQANAIEAILLQTLTKLMQQENLLDQHGEVSLEKLAQRSPLSDTQD